MSTQPSLFRPRNLLLGLGGLLLALGSYFVISDDARRGAELRVAEVAGDLATRVVAARAGENGGGHSSDFIAIPIEVRKLGEAIYQARGVGNTHVIATSAGHVVYDTGLATQAAKQRRLLDEALPEGPITHVILSHSHQDHVGGAPFWIEEGTQVVAHAEYDEEQRYLKEIVLPPELELTQIHGRFSWAVKSIWEYYATWFHFDSTTELYPVPRSEVDAEIAALAGVDALAQKAAEHVAKNENLKAIHLLEVSLAGDPLHRPSLLVRKEALSNLLHKAKSTFNNSYEIEWLTYRLRITDEALASN